MDIAAFDVIGIIIYLLIAGFIYKKGWFFSFYSFFKFILVFVLAMSISLYVASHNPIILPITKLQQSLLIQGATFIVLWRLISFKWLFFKSTDGILGINRFIFMHHVDRLLNIFPSLVASFFVSFFLFTVIVAASVSQPALQAKIEDSKIVKPLSYKIYFATLSANGSGLFEGVAYRLAPVFDPATYTDQEVDAEAVNKFRERLDQQREVAGLAPVGGIGTFTPENVTTEPVEPAPMPNQPPPVKIFPTRSPVGPPIIVQPTPIIIQENPPQDPVIQPTQEPPPTPNPTAIPIQIPFAAPTAGNISQMEQDIARLTNEQRAANGLLPLIFDNNIAAVARAHSQDMATRGFFDHNNPDGLDPFQRMRAGGISFSTGGENIAGGPTADIMMANWMNSAGHRANILRTNFGKIGVGVAVDPTYGFVATQNFTD